MKKIDKTKKTITILAICLVLAIGYIIVMKYNTTQQQRQFEIFQQGAQQGSQQTVLQIAQIAATCQPVALRIDENQTMNLISADCLQQTGTQE